MIGKILSTILLCGSGLSAQADGSGSGETMTPEQIEAWFNDDSEDRALAVNEGELAFLSKVPDKPAHHSHNKFIIDNNSLSTGWVGLTQCHSQLDAVPEAQIVYRYQRMKNLRIESFKGVPSGAGRAWIEGNSVQLENIQSGSELCIKAEVGILYSNSKGNFVLKNGPFHRKFLDGYYPMQVTLDIQFPGESIRFVSITPQPQDGFIVRQKKNNLYVNAWFEGVLMTEIHFISVVTDSKKRLKQEED